MNIIIKPKTLNGIIKAPPSKSMSHRTIIAASLSKGNSKITNLIFSEDILATCKALENFGAKIERDENFLNVFSKGKIEILDNNIECNESGSTLRFLIPFGAMVNSDVVFNGKGKLKIRPLTPYFDIFNKQLIDYNYDDSLPLIIKGKLKSGKFMITGDISSQFITGLMFALPLLEGDSEINITSPLESKGYIDLTLEILNEFNIKILNNNYKSFKIKGNQRYKNTDYKIEGDYSQAAFFIVAALIGEKIVINDLKYNSKQGDREIIEISKRMNGKIIIKEDNIFVYPSRTIGTIIDASQCPDIIPILTVLAALSEGTTEIINASRLRIKESDRLKAISTELNKLGADVKEKNDGLIIYGKDNLNGGIVDGWNDHRIVMSLAIASIKCKNDVTIIGSDAVKKSYPTFFEDFKKLGGCFNAK